MILPDAEIERLVASVRTARLATLRPSGSPHLVPITFATAGDRIVSAVDHKPKRTRRLRRLANITADPRVSVLFDHYDDADWSRLWWIRADGRARVVEAGPEREEAIALLVARYSQYQAQPPEGPAVVIDVERWSSWSWSGAG